MKKLVYLSVVMLIGLIACDDSLESGLDSGIETDEVYLGGDFSASLMGESGSKGGSSANGGGDGEAGVVTAANGMILIIGPSGKIS